MGQVEGLDQVGDVTEMESTGLRPSWLGHEEKKGELKKAASLGSGWVQGWVVGPLTCGECWGEAGGMWEMRGGWSQGEGLERHLRDRENGQEKLHVEPRGMSAVRWVTSDDQCSLFFSRRSKTAKEVGAVKEKDGRQCSNIETSRQRAPRGVRASPLRPPAGEVLLSSLFCN